MEIIPALGVYIPWSIYGQLYLHCRGLLWIQAGSHTGQWCGGRGHCCARTAGRSGCSGVRKTPASRLEPEGTKCHCCLPAATLQDTCSCLGTGSAFQPQWWSLLFVQLSDLQSQNKICSFSSRIWCVLVHHDFVDIPLHVKPPWTWIVFGMHTYFIWLNKDIFWSTYEVTERVVLSLDEYGHRRPWFLMCFLTGIQIAITSLDKKHRCFPINLSFTWSRVTLTFREPETRNTELSS